MAMLTRSKRNESKMRTRSSLEAGSTELRRQTKRRRTNISSSGKTKQDALQLNEDNWALVMAFLGPRELYNLAFLSKALMKCVTVPMVVQSSILRGGARAQNAVLHRYGFGGHTMSNLRHSMKHKSIHVPSPLRLLRLANGKRCEFCNISSVKYVHQLYGVFACWDCIAKSTKDPLTVLWDTKWTRFQRNPFYQAIFDHDRVCVREFRPRRLSLLSDEPETETTYYVWKGPRFTPSNERIGPLVTFKDIDAMATFCGSIEDYLESKLLAPPAEAYSEFLDTYYSTKERASVLADERRRKSIEQHDAMEVRRDRRQATVDNFIAALSAKMEEPWGESALCWWRVHEPKRGCAFVKFFSPRVNEILQIYITSPSKIRWSTVVNTAAQINALFRPLAEQRFHNFEFLSDTNPFESALKRHMKAKYPNMRALVRSEELDGSFFEMVASGKVLAAVVEHLEKFDLGFLLLGPEDRTSGALSFLASVLWNSKLRQRPEGENRYSKTFAACLPVWSDTKKAVVEYSTWLRDHHRLDEDVIQHAVHGLNYTSLDLLLKRDFHSLFFLVSERA